MLVRTTLCAALLSGIAYGQEMGRLPAPKQSTLAPPPSTPPHLGATPAPSGPYASWTSEQKQRGTAGIKFRCAMAGGMAMGSYSGKSKEGAKDETIALYASCVAKTMPSDWPDQQKARDAAQKYFLAAHQLDPDLPLEGNWSR